MFVAILIASNTIGAIPLFIGYGIKTASDPGIIGKMAANPSDISVMGFDPNVGLMMILFPSIVGIIAFILLVKPLNWRSFSMTINGTGSIRWKRFFISALVWTILSGMYLIIYLNIDPSNFILNNNTISLLYLTIISFLLIPFQAVFEEVIFRGYLMQGLAVLVRNRWIPLIMTTVLFGLLHTFNPEVKAFGFLTMMPEYLLFGLVFGVASIMDDGIEIAMGAHTANNIFICIFLTNTSSALQASSLYEQKNVYPWIEFLGLMITSIIFIFALKIIYRWNNFSRLWGKISENEGVIQRV
jgi:uncharacterized protein